MVSEELTSGRWARGTIWVARSGRARTWIADIGATCRCNRPCHTTLTPASCGILPTRSERHRGGSAARVERADQVMSSTEEVSSRRRGDSEGGGDELEVDVVVKCNRCHYECGARLQQPEQTPLEVLSSGSGELTPRCHSLPLRRRRVDSISNSSAGRAAATSLRERDRYLRWGAGVIARVHVFTKGVDGAN